MTLKVSLITGLSWPCTCDFAAEVILRLAGMEVETFGAEKVSDSFEIAVVFKGGVMLDVSRTSDALIWRLA
jgi:hypothetical protein